MFAILRKFYLGLFGTGGETGHKEPVLFVDGDGWLHGSGVLRYPSVRNRKLTTDGPIGIVWHYTATNHGTGISMAKRIRKYRRGKDRAASWHILITAKGEIVQSVSLERGSWHCARGTINGHRVNRCSVGIELEGQGSAFPKRQIAAASRVTRVIADTFGMTKSQCAHDHSQFDPKRRSDAGITWALIRERQLREIFATVDDGEILA